MLTLSVGSASCSEDEPIQGTGQQVTPGNGSGSGDNGSNNNGNNPDDNDDNNDDTPVSNNLKITIGPVSFNATLDNNETAKAFKRLLPMTVDMSELHGNEKYYYLSNGLPTASSNPGTIRTGDLITIRRILRNCGRFIQERLIKRRHTRNIKHAWKMAFRTSSCTRL